ncbi:MAG: hypothetical protein LKI08_09085 [Acetobacter sp.]|nr:hypothetical protein [Acetobacter sp.]MCI1529821.1 hypothetical protein [Acetobacter sp.]MCI1702640.1 hypothetical protein [Acetobacter sp.]
MQIRHNITTSSKPFPIFDAPVFHRAASVGKTIGRVRRYYAEADHLTIEANADCLGATNRAALRRDACVAQRSARRTLLRVAY